MNKKIIKILIAIMLIMTITNANINIKPITVMAEESEEVEYKNQYETEKNSINQAKSAYIQYYQAEGFSEHEEEFNTAESKLSEAENLYNEGRYEEANDSLEGVQELYIDALDNLKEKVEERKNEAEEQEETSSDCKTKPKIVCPNRTIVINGESILLTKKVTIGTTKYFPVGFNRSYSYLSYKVKSGSGKYISIDSTTGLIQGKKITNGKTAYVVVTATKNGKIIAQKTCSVKVYKNTSKNSEKDTVIQTQSDAIVAERELNSNPLGDTCEDEEMKKVTCKNINITKGKTKKVSSLYTTTLKSKKIKKISLSFESKNTSKKIVKKSGNNKKIKIKGNKKGSIDYTLKINNKETCTGTIKVKDKSSNKTTKKSSKKKSTKKSSKKSSSKSTKSSANGVTLSSIPNISKATIVVGQTKNVVGVVSPSSKSQEVTYSSSDKKIAKVDKYGTITGVKKGSATITIKTKDKKLSKKIKITVKKKSSDTKAVFNPESITLIENTVGIKESKKMSYEVIPSVPYGNKLSLVWSSSNPKVAAIDSSGIVIGKKAGDATITVISSKGTTNEKSSSAIVHVINAVKPTNIALESELSEIEVNGYTKINVIFNPVETTSKDIKWTSSNEKIATVSGGLVVGKKKGTVTIKATSLSNQKVKASIKIKVINKKTLDFVTSENYDLNVGDTVQILKDPSTANIYTFTSSKPSIASVNADGTINGIYPGDSIIRIFEIATNEVKGNIKVHVKSQNEQNTDNSTKLSCKSIKIAEGKSKTLTVTSDSSKTENSRINFSSANKKIATVNSKGKVTGKKNGSAKINISLKNNSNVTAACKVTVISSSSKKKSSNKNKSNSYKTFNSIDECVKYAHSRGTVIVRGNMSGAYISEYPSSMIRGNKYQLSKARIWDVEGIQAEDEVRTIYTSKTPVICTVSNKGKITAKKRGLCKITADAVRAYCDESENEGKVFYYESNGRDFYYTTSNVNITILENEKDKITIEPSCDGWSERKIYSKNLILCEETGKSCPKGYKKNRENYDECIRESSNYSCKSGEILRGTSCIVKSSYTKIYRRATYCPKGYEYDKKSKRCVTE